MAAYAENVDKTKDKRDLLTIESRAGYLYFRNYTKLFDKKKYGFVSRHDGGITLGNRYASDLINGLLNPLIGYLSNKPFLSFMLTCKRVTSTF